MSRESVLYLLKKFGVSPDTVRSQNFLVSDAVLQKILDASSLTTADRVLEIGSGIGTLTAELATRCDRVLSVEQDVRFQPLLNALTSVNTNVRVLYRDILRVEYDEVAAALDVDQHGGYKVVANIPYHITSRIISRLIGYPKPPEQIVLLVQREVGERIVAKDGDHSKLSLSVQFYGTPEIIAPVSHKDFYPEPDVDSVILRITDIAPWCFPEREKRVWQLIAFGFSAKRKKLVNNLAAGLILDKSKITAVIERIGHDAGVRAEALAPAEWRALASQLPE